MEDVDNEDWDFEGYEGLWGPDVGSDEETVVQGSLASVKN